MTQAALTDILGTKYRASCLKTPAVRWHRALRRLRFDVHSLQPLAWLIETESGRKFKLLKADAAFSHRIRSMMFGYEAACALDFVPRVVWHDSRNILLEFIDGETPDITSARFTRAFAKCLAEIHALDTGELSIEAMLYALDRDLSELVAGGLLQRQASDRLRRAMVERLPATLRTSLTYADLQLSNFCFARDGRLVFFDLGGFQRGRIIDEYFLGHPISQQLDLKLFKECYAAAGGNVDFFDLSDAIRLRNQIRMAAFYARILRDAPRVQLRQRRAYRLGRDEFVARLNEAA